MGRLITIPNFDQGINSQDDPEDTGKLLICQNFETDQRGQIYKRNAKHYITYFADKAVDAIIKWVQEDLNNGAEWIIFFRNSDTNKDEIARYRDTFGTSVAITDFGVASKDGDTCQIIPFTNVVRFANGRTRNPGIFQYIDREFFFGGWQPSAAFVYDTAKPVYPSTWDHLGIQTYGVGSNAAGYYYYKFVPVFDGTQEALFSDVQAYLYNSAADKSILVQMSLDTADFNKRITAIKVYRSYATTNIAPVYTHIKTIPVNTTATHEDKETHSATNVGKVLFDPDADFTSVSVGEYVYVNSNDFVITAVNSDHVIVSTVFGSAMGDGGWAGSWEIWDGAGGTGSKNAEGTNGYWGDNTVFLDSWSWQAGDRDGWFVVDSGSPTYYSGIITTVAKSLKLSTPSLTTGASVNIYLSNGYMFSISGSAVTLNLIDIDLNSGAYHPLPTVTNIDVNYKYGVYMNGRMLGLNLRVDSEDTAEDHPDWIGFSLLNHLDVIPIDNYIAVKDLQGGEIIGGAELGGDLAVLLERGVFRLDIPTDNPLNWRLVESNENIGCIAPHSIIKANGVLFFAGKSNVYALTGNYRDYPIADDIKDEYQAKASLEDSEFEYDHLKGRLLCRFGTDVETIYCFDVQKWLETGEKKWSTIECATSFKTDRFAIDEDSVVYTIYGERIHDLYDTDGSNETFAGQWKTGHIPVGVMGERGILREISISYLSAEAITVKIYIDKASAVAKTITLPANTSSGSRFVNRRLGLRANFFQVELLTPTSNTNNSTIEKLEILADE